MLDGLTDAVEVIDANVAHVRTWRPYIDEDEWDVAQLQIFEEEFLHPESHNGNALDTALNHPPNQTFHALRIVAGRGQHDLVAMLNGNGFKYLNDFRKERICDFRNYQPENSASPRNQSSRLRIGIIAKLIDNAPDPFGEQGINGGNAIDGAGNGGGRDSGSFRNFPYIHIVHDCRVAGEREDSNRQTFAAERHGLGPNAEGTQVPRSREIVVITLCNRLTTIK